MARGVNKVILIGNLGQDPELRHTDAGTAVCNMSVAVDESYTDKNGDRVEKTEWVDVVVWERLAEVCNEYLTRGSTVYFEGALQTNEWEDADGNTRYSTEVKAFDMTFLDSKGDSRSGSGAGGEKADQRQGGNGPQFDPEDEDGMPF